MSDLILTYIKLKPCWKKKIILFLICFLINWRVQIFTMSLIFSRYFSVKLVFFILNEKVSSTLVATNKIKIKSGVIGDYFAKKNKGNLTQPYLLLLSRHYPSTSALSYICKIHKISLSPTFLQYSFSMYEPDLHELKLCLK